MEEKRPGRKVGRLPEGCPIPTKVISSESESESEGSKEFVHIGSDNGN